MTAAFQLEQLEQDTMQQLWRVLAQLDRHGMKILLAQRGTGERAK